MKEHSAVGMNKEKSKLSGHPGSNADTTSQIMQLELNLDWTPVLISSTPELVPAPKNPILTDKLSTLPPNIQREKSSQKSEAVLTLNGKRCLPYWEESCQEMSNALWSLTRTDWQDLDLTSSDGSANKTGVNSWFSMSQVSLRQKNWLKMFSPSLTASVQGFTDSANTRLRCKKIRIYPSVELNNLSYF